MAAFIATAVLCLLLYDFLLKPLSVIYALKIRPRLSFLSRG